jgi:antirestriction protein ArdC
LFPYAEVSARIIAELERSAAPWVKPWSATAGQNVPQNAVTNRSYSGCNVVLLWLACDRGWATPRFLTFKQAIEAGGNVRRGEHRTKIYFVKQLQIKNDGDEADARLNAVKCDIESQGLKHSCVAHKVITAAANVYLSEHPELVTEAAETVRKVIQLRTLYEREMRERRRIQR